MNAVAAAAAATLTLTPSERNGGMMLGALRSVAEPHGLVDLELHKN